LDNWLAKNPIYVWLKRPSSKLVLRARELIASRLRDEKHVAGTDFMDRFLEQKRQHPGIVDDQVLVGYVGTNIIAGSDTTAVVLRSILYYTLKTPGVLQRIREELHDSGTEYPVPYQTATALPYLDAVIREAMRIHPIGVVILERIVHDGGLQLQSGHKLEPGTIVGMTPWTLHFDESIFGKDPEIFNPDRWLQQSGESDEAYQQRFASMKHNEFSFSYGPRVCLGRNIATLEIYTVMPTLLGLFDVSL
jgi:cytochrome P450